LLSAVPQHTTTVLSQKQRFWVAPPVNFMISSVGMGQHQSMSFVVDLTAPAVAFLLEHCVTSRSILPATGELIECLLFP